MKNNDYIIEILPLLGKSIPSKSLDELNSFLINCPLDSNERIKLVRIINKM